MFNNSQNNVNATHYSKDPMQISETEYNVTSPEPMVRGIATMKPRAPEKSRIRPRYGRKESRYLQEIIPENEQLVRGCAMVPSEALSISTNIPTPIINEKASPRIHRSIDKCAEHQENVPSLKQQNGYPRILTDALRELITGNSVVHDTRSFEPENDQWSCSSSLRAYHELSQALGQDSIEPTPDVIDRESRALEDYYRDLRVVPDTDILWNCFEDVYELKTKALNKLYNLMVVTQPLDQRFLKEEQNVMLDAAVIIPHLKWCLKQFAVQRRGMIYLREREYAYFRHREDEINRKYSETVRKAEATVNLKNAAIRKWKRQATKWKNEICRLRKHMAQMADKTTYPIKSSGRQLAQKDREIFRLKQHITQMTNYNTQLREPSESRPAMFSQKQQLDVQELNAKFEAAMKAKEDQYMEEYRAIGAKNIANESRIAALEKENRQAQEEAAMAITEKNKLLHQNAELCAGMNQQNGQFEKLTKDAQTLRQEVACLKTDAIARQKLVHITNLKAEKALGQKKLADEEMESLKVKLHEAQVALEIKSETDSGLGSDGDDREAKDAENPAPSVMSLGSGEVNTQIRIGGDRLVKCGNLCDFYQGRAWSIVSKGSFVCSKGLEWTSMAQLVGLSMVKDLSRDLPTCDDAEVE